MAKLIAVNERGYRIGEDHHNAQATDSDVEQCLRLHAQGYGYRRIARIMGIGRSTVRDYITGKRRAQRASKFRRVRVTPE